MEAKVGAKWYVCSEYKYWRAIQHIKYKDATDGWVLDTTETNEVVTGTIEGFAGSWTDVYQ